MLNYGLQRLASVGCLTIILGLCSVMYNCETLAHFSYLEFGCDWKVG